MAETKEACKAVPCFPLIGKKAWGVQATCTHRTVLPDGTQGREKNTEKEVVHRIVMKCDSVV